MSLVALFVPFRPHQFYLGFASFAGGRLPSVPVPFFSVAYFWNFEERTLFVGCIGQDDLVTGRWFDDVFSHNVDHRQGVRHRLDTGGVDLVELAEKVDYSA